MRAIPTFSYSALSDWRWENASGSGITPTAITQAADEASTKTGNLRGTVASGFVAGNATLLYAANTLNARANWSAEL
jgi:hypothetical protein